MSVHLAKFDELVENSKTEEADDEKDEGRPRIRMALSSTEKGSGLRTSVGGETSEMFNPKTQSSTDGSQIRWVDPTEELERQKLADKASGGKNVIRI